MRIIHNIVNAVRSLTSQSSSGKLCLSEIDRAVISEYSNRNIFLQFGKYYTRDDIERELNEVANYDFS